LDVKCVRRRFRGVADGTDELDAAAIDDVAFLRRREGGRDEVVFLGCC